MCRIPIDSQRIYNVSSSSNSELINTPIALTVADAIIIPAIGEMPLAFMCLLTVSNQTIAISAHQGALYI
jgi:hypothetical protein